MGEIRNVAIIGGGIGGLCAALALHRAGVETTVFEQAPEIKPLGASISLWSNAVTCLASWGVENEICAAGAAIDALKVFSQRGKSLMDMPLTSLHQKLGHGTFCVKRSDIQQLLAQALPANGIKLNHQLKTFAQDSNGATLGFANGTSGHFDLVIGADGLHSQMRQHLFNDGLPEYAGYGAWLGLSRIELSQELKNSATEYHGAGQRFGLMETGHGEVYWFFVENRPHPVAAVETRPVSALLPELQDWPAELGRIVAATQDGKAQYVSFFQRPVRKNWGKGNALLLGDAVHPYVPNLGQGACQAIEDAYILGKALTASRNMREVQAFYEQHRVKRATMFSEDSRKIGQRLQVSNPISCKIRDLVVSLIPNSLNLKQFQTYLTLPPL